MTIDVLLDCHATIGESPTWSPVEGAIYWIDVKEPALHRRDREGRARTWPLASDVGAFALTDGPPGAVVALRTGLYDLDLQTGTAELHNGAAWTPDGRSLLLAHSNMGRIYRHSYDPDSGGIGPGQPFATVATADGLPDGAAMDEQGCYWCAIHGGSVLHRYDPKGRLLGVVDLPVSQPTMCAFVGDDLDEMVVTTARDRLTPRQLEREPLAGAMLRLRPGVRGVPRPCVVR